MGHSYPETVCAIQPAALRPVPVPSSALLARLAPLTPVPGRPDLAAHHAPDVFALWQAWEEECGAPQAVPFWATVWPAGQLLASAMEGIEKMKERLLSQHGDRIAAMHGHGGGQRVNSLRP